MLWFTVVTESINNNFVFFHLTYFVSNVFLSRHSTKKTEKIHNNANNANVFSPDNILLNNNNAILLVQPAVGEKYQRPKRILLFFMLNIFHTVPLIRPSIYSVLVICVQCYLFLLYVFDSDRFDVHMLVAFKMLKRVKSMMISVVVDTSVI